MIRILLLARHGEGDVGGYLGGVEVGGAYGDPPSPLALARYGESVLTNSPG
jgi:hypothetical protein